MTTINIKTTPVSDFTSVNQEERKALRIKGGDTVKVSVKIAEKDKVRIQVFEGLVLSTKHGNEAGATFTVRKVSNGVGVERIFPLYSPNIDKIEIVKRAKVRRSKLYHLRDKVAKQIKRQMRRASMVNIATSSDIEETERLIKEAESKKAEEEAKAAEAQKAAEEKAAAEAAKVEEEAKANEPAEEVKEEESVETETPSEEGKTEEK